MNRIVTVAQGFSPARSVAQGFSPVLLTLLIACRATQPAAPEAIRFTLDIPEGRILDAFAMSRDGQWVAYSAETTDGRRQIFVRDLRAASAADRAIPGTDGGTHPFFSTDGNQLAYFARGSVWRVKTHADGPPLKIAAATSDTAGGTWTDDGRVVFAASGNRGLLSVVATGGTPAALTILGKDEIAHGWPHALPGGAVAFTVSQRNRDSHLEVASSEGTRTRLRVPIFGQSAFVEPGYLAYSYLGNLMAVAFDPEEPAITSVPTVIARGVQTSAHATLGRAGFAVSGNGTLVWLRATPEDAKSHIVRVDADGHSRSMVESPAIYQTPRLSPDGRRLAVTVRPDVMTREIHVIDISRPNQPLFTIRGGDNQSPAWMDNRSLTFGSNRDGNQQIYVFTPNERPRALFSAHASKPRNPARWIDSPRLLAFYEIDAVRGRDVLVYRGGDSVEPVVATGANERSPVPSPDGRWIAYVSDTSGRDEVYIKPLDLSLDALQMTSSGATEPVWTRAGLFYREGDRMMKVALDGGAPGSLHEMFERRFERDPGANLPAYDVAGDGTFIMLKSALRPRELRVVRNWATELRRAVR